MKFNKKNLPNSQLEIEIELSSDELDNYINQAVLRLGENLEIEGFRKGTAPKEIIEQRIGKENILVEAADMAVKDNYKKVILENNIEAIQEPEIKILKLAVGNPFSFKIKTAILPEIELPDYKKIASEVPKNKVVVEEKEIGESLEWIRKSRAKFISKNGTCQKGDFVEIIYSSPQIENNKEIKDGFILGEGHFIPGFEESLFGLEAGQEKEFSLDAPPNSSIKNLAGEKVGFKVKINSVQKVELPEIDDQFAKNIGNFENLEALKKNLKEGIGSEKEQMESRKQRAEILERISKACFDSEISQKTNPAIPEILIKKEHSLMLADFKKNVENNFKISFQEYILNTGKSEKEIEESILKEAKKRVKNFLILREIGKKEKIEVLEKELEEEVNKVFKKYPDIKEKEKLDLEKLKLYTEGVIRQEKVFKLLENFVK